MASGSQESVRFEEYHLVDKSLLNLMRVLPNGSVWLGVTRLQTIEAWTEGIAKQSYFRFQNWCRDEQNRRRFSTIDCRVSITKIYKSV